VDTANGDNDGDNDNQEGFENDGDYDGGRDPSEESDRVERSNVITFLSPPRRLSKSEVNEFTVHQKRPIEKRVRKSFLKAHFLRTKYVQT